MSHHAVQFVIHEKYDKIHALGKRQNYCNNGIMSRNEIRHEYSLKWIAIKFSVCYWWCCESSHIHRTSKGRYFQRVIKFQSLAANRAYSCPIHQPIQQSGYKIKTNESSISILVWVYSFRFFESDGVPYN